MVPSRSMLRGWTRTLAALALVAAGATGASRASEPPDGTTLLANYSAFDLDAAASDNVAGAAAARDGKLVVAGWASDGANRWVLVASRYLTNSILDTSFGNAGHVVNPIGYGGTTFGRATAVLADGAVLIGGTIDWGSGNSDFLVVKLTPSGVLDTSFGTAFGGGFTVIPFDLGDDDTDEGNAMVVDRSGRILIAGTVDIAPGDRDMGLVRLQSNGYLDTSFGTNGKVVIPFDLSGPDFDLGLGVAVGPAGQIAVAGATRYQPSGGSTSLNFAVARLTATGALDASFGSGGRQIAAFDIGGTRNDVVRAVAVDPHGRVVLGGEVAWASGETVWAVMRLQSNGGLDLGFNGSGFRLDTFTCAPAACGVRRDYINALALQGDGRILVAGAAYLFDTGNTDLGVARLLDNGAFDSSFSGDGKLTYDWNHGPGSDNDVANAVVVGADGRPLVAGTIEYDFPDMDWGHLTLANHYVFADGFELGSVAPWSAAVTQ
jgi:uncharacterized delta-60 repeat protein